MSLMKNGVSVGLAYWPNIESDLKNISSIADYVELPFEQLRQRPSLLSMQESIPLVLHCASLSIAGFVAPSTDTIRALVDITSRIATPWVGEHLAFVSADGLEEAADRDVAPTNLTYTLCPQLSEQTIDRVAKNLVLFKSHLDVPIILENSPQYYQVPGSTMNMTEFISRVADRCDVDLLLDLSHHMITCKNTGVDPFDELEKLPLERVVEIHLSGMSEQSGVMWDDHAVPATPETFALFERVLSRATPKAVTLEYNWSELPQQILLNHLAKTREFLGV